MASKDGKDKTYDWKSPVSYDARTMTKVVREVLDERKWTYRREKGEMPYSKFMIVMPMPKFAYVYRFVVEEPVQIKIQSYDTRPTHSGLMPFLEIKGITDENAGEVKEVLRAIHDRLPRPAWQFTLGQKFQYALLATEYRQAKKAWKSMGFRV